MTSHKARLLPVLWHQLRSPLLVLLLAAALASYFVAERSGALIIGAIIGLPVSLGFVNEYRAERAAAALHSQVHHQTVVRRAGRLVAIDVTMLVPGEVVELKLGDIVSADCRTSVGRQAIRQSNVTKPGVTLSNIGFQRAVPTNFPRDPSKKLVTCMTHLELLY